MSYCKMGDDSDVYVFVGEGSDGEECWVCHWCKFLSEVAGVDNQHYESSEAGMLQHLTRHVDAGHKVPEHAMRRLTEEMAQRL